MSELSDDEKSNSDDNPDDETAGQSEIDLGAPDDLDDKSEKEPEDDVSEDQMVVTEEPPPPSFPPHL